MLKYPILILLAIVSFTLASCTSGVSGLQSYIDGSDGYQFLYPNGWLQVDVKGASPGVDVVFRDIIERTENLSVIISEVPSNKTLTDLGTPSEVGYRFLKEINRDKNSNRNLEFISAQSHESGGQTYYTLEYQVTLPQEGERHNLASVAVSHGKLYTFNLSTSEQRWEKVKNLFETVVNSFSVIS